MKNSYFLIGFLILISCKQEAQKPPATIQENSKSAQVSMALQPEVEAIVKAHGMQNWDTVDEISFTFNVDREGKNVAKRSWIWKPKTNDVTMITATDTVSYNRSDLESESITADQGFINDKYWLLAPYQIAWDEGTTITTDTVASAPLSQKPMKKLTVIYGAEGGYTPGDAYDFYYEKPAMIKEWAYRKGNAQEPSLVTTFEDYRNVNGLLLATNHKDKDGSFRLYFTDISIKRTE